MACQLPLPPFNCCPTSKDRPTCSQKGVGPHPSEGQHWKQVGAEAEKNIFFLKLFCFYQTLVSKPKLNVIYILT